MGSPLGEALGNQLTVAELITALEAVPDKTVKVNKAVPDGRGEGGFLGEPVTKVFQIGLNPESPVLNVILL